MIYFNLFLIIKTFFPYQMGNKNCEIGPIKFVKYKYKYIILNLWYINLTFD